MVVMVAAFALVQWGNLWMKRVLVLPVVWDLPRQAEALVSIRSGAEDFKAAEFVTLQLKSILSIFPQSLCKLFRSHGHLLKVAQKRQYLIGCKKSQSQSSNQGDAEKKAYQYIQRYLFCSKFVGQHSWPRLA